MTFDSIVLCVMSYDVMNIAWHWTLFFFFLFSALPFSIVIFIFYDAPVSCLSCYFLFYSIFFFDHSFHFTASVRIRRSVDFRRVYFFCFSSLGLTLNWWMVILIRVAILMVLRHWTLALCSKNSNGLTSNFSIRIAMNPRIWANEPASHWSKYSTMYIM